MPIRRCLVASLAVWMVAFAVVTRSSAQSLADVAAEAARKRAAFAASPEGQRQVAEKAAAEAAEEGTRRAALAQAAKKAAVQQRAREAEAARTAAREKATRDAERADAERRAQLIKNRKPDEIRQQFSWWNGSHPGLTALIKATLKDPDSYKHVDTRYVDMGDFLLVTTTYRATNGFNAVVPGMVKAVVDFNGHVVKVIAIE